MFNVYHLKRYLQILNCSTLTELHVNVQSFFDCLYLLDGCFPQLRIFHVNTVLIRRFSRQLINNTENLPHLERFSLCRDQDSSGYDELLGRGECHIYSYPYEQKENHRINNFRGGMFKYVREISLLDERPFDHKFFFQISQSFPLMEKLTLINGKAQNDKNENLLLIEYPHLFCLDLVEVHEDYLEQFLIDTNTCLPNNVYLMIDYQVLKKATRNFIRQTMRTNCSKRHRLVLFRECEITDDLGQYFPQAKIS
ncbi:hypothetical protein I4U23_010648 [Adineta vaga]|nr:hypothetical protein I4U23_010648 [Adineta vaga]